MSSRKFPAEIDGATPIARSAATKLLSETEQKELFECLGELAVFDAAFNRLQANAIRDPNATRRYASMLRKRAENFHKLVLEVEAERAPPMPPIDSITALQVTIWDNWLDGKPKRGEKGARAERFKASIEAWTEKSGDKITSSNRAFSGTVHLMDSPTLKAKVSDLKSTKKTIRPFAKIDELDAEGDRWDAYAQTLTQVASVFIGFRAGPIFTVGKGTHFHLDQWMVAKEVDLLDQSPSLKAAINTPSGIIDLEGFVSTTSRGAPLTKGAILSTRMTNRKDLAKWMTANLTYSNQ